jgi:thiamine biosynthesis lipoprotein
MLFEAVRFAVAVAEATGGAFDPTVGGSMERRGFDTNYRTKRSIRTPIGRERGATYRDIALDSRERTVLCQRPLLLDLGAVAKGLAIDLAAVELAGYPNFAIEAGGDLYAAGRSASGRPWSIGIRHPRRPDWLIDVCSVSDGAVCTSGDYERASPTTGHHILDPRQDAAAGHAASATVRAPRAMLADALATAAFVLGPGRGIELLEQHCVDGLIVTPTLESYATSGYHT